MQFDLVEVARPFLLQPGTSLGSSPERKVLSYCIMNRLFDLFLQWCRKKLWHCWITLCCACLPPQSDRLKSLTFLCFCHLISYLLFPWQPEIIGLPSYSLLNLHMCTHTTMSYAKVSPWLQPQLSRRTCSCPSSNCSQLHKWCRMRQESNSYWKCFIWSSQLW